MTFLTLQSAGSFEPWSIYSKRCLHLAIRLSILLALQPIILRKIFHSAHSAFSSSYFTVYYALFAICQPSETGYQPELKASTIALFTDCRRVFFHSSVSNLMFLGEQPDAARRGMIGVSVSKRTDDPHIHPNERGICRKDWILITPICISFSIYAHSLKMLIGQNTDLVAKSSLSSYIAVLLLFANRVMQDGSSLKGIRTTPSLSHK